MAYQLTPAGYLQRNHVRFLKVLFKPTAAAEQRIPSGWHRLQLVQQVSPSFSNVPSLSPGQQIRSFLMLPGPCTDLLHTRPAISVISSQPGLVRLLLPEPAHSRARSVCTDPPPALGWERQMDGQVSSNTPVLLSLLHTTC